MWASRQLNNTTYRKKNNKMNIELLSKPACMQCDATDMTFASGNVKFTKTDMTQNPEALALAKSFGFMQAPVVVVRDLAGNIIDKWSGFNPAKIAEYSA